MNEKEPVLTISRDSYDAVIFDLDGVVTKTAKVHAAAWKQLFDEYLERGRHGEGNQPFQPFDLETDYRRYVDGKPRYEGVKSFLAARGITLPYGAPDDPPGRETVCGLGNRKNLLFKELWEIEVSDDACGSQTNMDLLPSALERVGEIAQRAGNGRIAVFLDYDGTLTPIVEHPDEALLTDDMRNTLRHLASLCTVAVISGRDLRDVRERTGIDGIFYAGSHGFDIAGPQGRRMESERGTEFLPTLDRAEEALREQLQSINGALVERKKFSIAIHYRSVKEDDIGEIEKAVDRILIKHPKLRKSRGKKIFELQPDIDWHKGKALLWLIDTLELDRSNTLPFYIGDDTTDEDAFNTLRGLGFGIVILEGSRCTAATYSLKNPDEVEAFLKSLASMLEEESQ